MLYKCAIYRSTSMGVVDSAGRAVIGHAQCGSETFLLPAARTVYITTLLLPNQLYFAVLYLLWRPTSFSRALGVDQCRDEPPSLPVSSSGASILPQRCAHSSYCVRANAM